MTDEEKRFERLEGISKHLGTFVYDAESALEKHIYVDLKLPFPSHQQEILFWSLYLSDLSWSQGFDAGSDAVYDADDKPNYLQENINLATKSLKNAIKLWVKY